MWRLTQSRLTGSANLHSSRKLTFKVAVVGCLSTFDSFVSAHKVLKDNFFVSFLSIICIALVSLVVFIHFVYWSRLREMTYKLIRDPAALPYRLPNVFPPPLLSPPPSHLILPIIYGILRVVTARRSRWMNDTRRRRRRRFVSWRFFPRPFFFRSLDYIGLFMSSFRNDWKIGPKLRVRS